MSSNRSYLLAYHPANFDEAGAVNDYLTKAGYSIAHLKSNQFSHVGDFAKAIEKSDSPLILLVSDNFLKSAECLYGFFDVFKQVRDSRELVVIICEGKVAINNDFEQVKTSFEKLSGLIKYLNTWQNQYLDLRTQKRSIPDEKREQYEQQLRTTRNISTEVGDFMKSINELGPLDYPTLANTNFEAFYLKVNDLGSFENYLRILAEEASAELSPEPKPAVKEAPFKIAKEPQEDFPKVIKPEEVIVEDVIIEDDDDEEEEIIKVIVPNEESILPKFKPTEQVLREVEEESAELAKLPLSVTAPAGDLNILFEKDMSDPSRETPLTESVATILAQANQFFKSGNEADGLRVLKNGIAQHPKDTALRYEYGASLARYTRSYNLAKYHLKQNLDIDPNHAKSLFLLGRMAELDGDRRTAINFYKGVADVQKDFPEVNFRLGLLYLITGTGDKKEVKKYLKKELEINSKNVEATYRLGTLLAETEKKKDKGLKMFQKVLELDPEHKFVYYDLALLFYKHDDFKKASLFYQKACDVNPELKTAENDAAFGLRKVDKPVQLKAKSTNKTKNRQVKPGKTILITGATSGIGRATANVFAENGYRLILTGRRLERLEELKTDFEKEHGSKVQILNFDVRDKKSTESAVNSLPEDWKNVDILLNNAGLAKGFSAIHEGDYSHWEAMIDTNLKGLLYMTRTVAPHMVKRKSGHIINIGSIAGKEAYPNGNVYNATKFAVDGLTKAMRIDLVHHNIRVSQVCPGHVEETEFAKVRFDGDEERAKIYNDFNPLTSRDVAETIYFIATRPAHVNISDVLITATQQATATIVSRTGRKNG